MTCVYCDAPAVDNTQPAMCEKHLDLFIMAGYLVERNKAVTVEAVQQLVYVCQARNGVLSLQVEEVEMFLSGDFAARYQTREISGAAS